MTTLTTEQAQQIEESLARISDKRNTHFAGDAQVVAGEALAIIQAARAQEPITTPDVCGEVCARAKLCYGCNKDLEEANAKYVEQAEQEPVAWMSLNKERLEFSRKDTVYGSHTIPLYASPVRTKDLMDYEINNAWNSQFEFIDRCRAVIAADRELNRA